MATKEKKAPKKTGSKAKGAKASKSNGVKTGDVRLGPRHEKAVRVPINATQYAKKESEIAQLELAISRIQSKIRPDTIEIRKNRKLIAKLTVDLEENTEERKMMVRNEYHDNQNMTRVLRADNGTVIEERPMSEEERQIDVEDEHTTVIPTADQAPAATPGEAMAAARTDGTEGSA